MNSGAQFALTQIQSRELCMAGGVGVLENQKSVLSTKSMYVENYIFSQVLATESAVCATLTFITSHKSASTANNKLRI